MPINRLVTSFKMQALEYRQRRLLLLILVIMPALLFAGNYYTVPGGNQLPLDVPTRAGTETIYVDERETWPMTIGVIGITWAVASVAFFGVVGSLRKDRRLLLCGYRAWQILLARVGILLALAVPLALIGMIPYTLITSARHPEIVGIACFMAACMAGGFGLLVGILVPRPLEGLLLVILVTGIGMSLGGDAAKYFFLYPSWQMVTIGRLSTDPWPYPYLGLSLAYAVGMIGLALALWWWRTRLPLRAQP